MKTATRNNFERDETCERFFARIDGHCLRAVGRGASGPGGEGRVACLCCECAGAQANDYVRVPGLFRRWEIQHVVDTSADFNIEAAGCTEDSTELFSVYRRQRPAPTHGRKEE